jgi:hypothetical protein
MDESILGILKERGQAGKPNKSMKSVSVTATPPDGKPGASQVSALPSGDYSKIPQLAFTKWRGLPLANTQQFAPVVKSSRF